MSTTTEARARSRTGRANNAPKTQALRKRRVTNPRCPMTRSIVTAMELVKWPRRGRVNRKRCQVQAMTAFDLFSIGHSNIAADRFIALLRDAGADAIADVRSTPYSRFFPWFSRKNLEARLVAEGMAYLPYGEPLGGRPQAQSLYRNGIADYEAMAQHDDFRASLGRLQSDALRRRVCLMCAEREPLDCHRCLL